MTQLSFALHIEPHCRIGRIRFKSHRGREPRKDAARIKAAREATTARLLASTYQQGRG